MHLVSYRYLDEAVGLDLPPLTNMSGIELHVEAETMYTVEDGVLGAEGVQRQGCKQRSRQHDRT